MAVQFTGRFIEIVLPRHECYKGIPVRLRRYTVVNRKSGEMVAWIRWYGPWRCWAFLPCEGTVWSADYLADVGRFLGQLASRGAQRKEAVAP